MADNKLSVGKGRTGLMLFVFVLCTAAVALGYYFFYDFSVNGETFAPIRQNLENAPQSEAMFNTVLRVCWFAGGGVIALGIWAVLVGIFCPMCAVGCQVRPK